MRPALAAAVVSAVLVLSACSDTHVAGPTPSTHHVDTLAPPPSSTDIARSTATSSAPVMPEMPATARQKTTAGAKAFVRYYIDVLNYSFSTPDPQPLRLVSAESCTACQPLLSICTRLAEKGGGQIGGAWDPISLVAGASDRQSQFLVARIRVSAGTSRGETDGPIHQIEAKNIRVMFQLTWQAKSWLLQDLAPA
jgi:hypothetical protein